MIRQALQHLPGIGPERLKALDEAGIRDWSSLRRRPDVLFTSPKPQDRLLTAIDRCEAAVCAADVRYLVRAFASSDQWRILGHFFDRAAYFDIETSGLDVDSYVTVVSCYHRGSLHVFSRGSNLEAFLDLLEDIDLLVSFNGASFDVPRIEQEFHIPSLPCAHVDLRWICHHEQMRGGLKSIEQRLGIERPNDLHGVSGEDAVWLWRLWEDHDNTEALDRLVRYCGADVLTLQMLAARMLQGKHVPVNAPTPQDLWGLLDVLRPATPPAAREPEPPAESIEFDTASRLQRRLEQTWQRRRHAR